MAFTQCFYWSVMLYREHIRLSRAFLQMSLTDLASFSNVSYSYLKKIEKGFGIVECGSSVMTKIMDVFKNRGIILLEQEGIPYVRYEPSNDKVGALKATN